MIEVFGNFIEMGDTQEYLIISFSSGTLPIQDRWRNNSLSADFLANYWGSFFPIHGGKSHHKRSEVQDSVSFIANELLENAVKFSFEPEYSIKIGLYLSESELRFYVSNSVNPNTIEEFQELIQKLLTEDPDELYMRQLEKNANEDGDDESHLGFLTILNDYNATLAWKFETIQEDPKIVTVNTMVQLKVRRQIEVR